MSFFKDAWDLIKNTATDIWEAKTWVQKGLQPVHELFERVDSIVDSSTAEALVDIIPGQLDDEGLDWLKFGVDTAVKMTDHADEYNECLKKDSTLEKVACILAKAKTRGTHKELLQEAERANIRWLIQQATGDADLADDAAFEFKATPERLSRTDKKVVERIARKKANSA